MITHMFGPESKNIFENGDLYLQKRKLLKYFNGIKPNMFLDQLNN